MRASGGAPVIFGEPGDAWLLGALSLESLGLLLDPFKRELRPMRLVLYATGSLRRDRELGLGPGIRVRSTLDLDHHALQAPREPERG